MHHRQFNFFCVLFVLRNNKYQYVRGWYHILGPSLIDQKNISFLHRCMHIPSIPSRTFSFKPNNISLLPSLQHYAKSYSYASKQFVIARANQHQFFSQGIVYLNSWICRKKPTHSFNVLFLQFPSKFNQYIIQPFIRESWNRNPIDIVNQKTRTRDSPNDSNAFTINGQPIQLYQCFGSSTFLATLMHLIE